MTAFFLVHRLNEQTTKALLMEQLLTAIPIPSNVRAHFQNVFFFYITLLNS